MKRYLIPIIFVFSGYAQAVSFDCSKARSFSEKEICSSQELSNQDDELFTIFKSAKESTNNNPEFRKLARDLWNDREKCQTYQCINNWYSNAKDKYLSLGGGSYQESKVEPIKKTNTPSEDLFVQIVKKSQEESIIAKNEMAKGGVKAVRDKEICGMIGDGAIKNWKGKITKLGANSDGKGVLAVEISPGVSLKTWNNSLSDTFDNTLIEPGTNLFSIASSLSEGDEVIFSGSMASDQDSGECAKESSIGLNGGLKEPEFIFKFSKIGKADSDEPVLRQELNDKAQDIYITLLKGFARSCVLIGEGNDEAAISVINNMVFPGNQKNPVAMSDSAFKGMKDYFMQYRHLNDKNCSTYARDFIAASMQQ